MKTSSQKISPEKWCLSAGRGGDSLQGRYHFLRLLPLTLGELHPPNHENLLRLQRNSGFPEPFTMDSEIESRRWSREFRSRLVRDDLRDLENIRNIVSIETLAMRLPELVGSPLSINAVREDLQVSHQSISRWLDMQDTQGKEMDLRYFRDVDGREGISL